MTRHRVEVVAAFIAGILATLLVVSPVQAGPPPHVCERKPTHPQCPAPSATIAPPPSVTAGPTIRPTQAPTVAPTATLPATAAPPAPTATTPPAALTVLDFGATPNDGTNDTAAFNNALSAARTIGVPAGTYHITSVRPAAGSTLAGEPGAILARFGLGSHAGPGVIHVTTTDVTIRDLVIRGTGRRLTSTTTGQGDDVLINGIGSHRLRVQRVGLENAQGIGIQTESATGMLFEDLSITNTFVRDNGYHGVALWPYTGTKSSTFRRITIDGADYAGIMLDAGTTGGGGASVDDNAFTDITIRNAARFHIAGGGIGGGWLFTGGSRNTVTRYTITDIPAGAALAFGADQSGIGNTGNVLTTGTVARLASGIAIAFGGASTGNAFDGGTGAGRVTGPWAGNTFTDWPELTFG